MSRPRLSPDEQLRRRRAAVRRSKARARGEAIPYQKRGYEAQCDTPRCPVCGEPISADKDCKCPPSP